MINFGVTEYKSQQLRRRMKSCGLFEADLEEKFIRSGGPGGQKVNKTATCVYLKHVPSGLQVKMQQERTQGLNRFFARRRMCELREEKLPGNVSPETLKQQKKRKQKDRRRRRNKAPSS